MPDQVDDLDVYLVELDVEGVAIVSVVASSSDEACERAESQAKPADVTELDVCEVRRVVRVEALPGELKRATLARAREKAPAGSEHGRQSR